MISVTDGRVTYHLASPSPGRASVKVRFGQSETLLVLADDLEPRAALDLVRDLIKDRTTQVELAGLAIRTEPTLLN